MNFNKEALRLYAVTDRTWIGKQTLLEQVESALKGGVTCVQLREKTLDEASFLAEAVEMNALCQRYGVPLLINDNVEIALRSGAAGVHVGQSDRTAAEIRAIAGDDFIIGVTARTVEQALAAEAAGADYLGSGAAFGSTTKLDAKAIDHAVLKEICAAVAIPVVAIGGITEENMMALQGLGTEGVALVSTIFAAEDIEEKCAALKKMVEQMVQKA